MTDNPQPTLFGLSATNRNFTAKDDWGKNVFNNAFPAALACYMHSKGIKPVYLVLDEQLSVRHDKIDVKELFNHEPTSDRLFFDFESLYLPYEPLVSSTLPRIDLVLCHMNESRTIESCVRGLEIKLTAVPDNSTALAAEEDYGPELVVRPDTIVYLALSIATNYSTDRNRLANLIVPTCRVISDWNDTSEIANAMEAICTAINNVLLDSLDKQEPLVLQPIWKTNGKSLELDEHCVDCFVWSDYGFTRLFVDTALRNGTGGRVSRQGRTCVWLLKMLYDFVNDGKINHSATIRNINYRSQTDKAFAASGRVTRTFLRSDELLRPRITKHELKNIILNGGEQMLSPERRFDAAIVGNASLFEQ